MTDKYSSFLVKTANNNMQLTAESVTTFAKKTAKDVPLPAATDVGVRINGK